MVGSTVSLSATTCSPEPNSSAIQDAEVRCRWEDVSISPESITAASQAALETDRQIAVMKKSRDVEQDTAEALLQLVKQSAPPPMPEHVGTLVNVLA
jgi:hypothetical protein